MAQYNYIAKDDSGKTYKGSAQAQNKDELKQRLKETGFYALSIKREKAALVLGSGKVKAGELVIFSRQFSAMAAAGLPLNKTLKALEKQTENQALKEAVNEIRISIEGGSSLSQAFAKYPNIFSGFFITMLKAGEAGGTLKKVLERLANHLEKQDNLRRSVRGAFAYPAIVGILAVLVVSFLIIFIVPVFQNVYLRLNLTLPLPTLVLIGISGFARSFWWQILTAAAVSSFFIKRISRKKAFQKYWDNFKMNMPVFGKLTRKVTAVRFIHVFADMVESGLPIVEALRIADKVAANRAVSEIAALMADNIYRGELISKALAEQSIFPASVVQMVATGEESGTLGFMLRKSAEGLAADADDTIKRLVVKIEPLMTFLLALVVGFIAIAIYLPIFDVIKEVAGG